jgi:hypothetical protein
MFCSNCGNEINKNDKFCMACGTENPFYEEHSDNGHLYRGERITSQNIGNKTESKDFDGKKAAPQKEIRRGKNFIVLSIVTIALAAVLVLQNLSIIPGFFEMFGNKANGVIEDYSILDIGYDTPEEAIEAFANAIASEDLETAIALFGSGHKLEEHDYSKFIMQTGYWYSSNWRYSPASDGVLKDSTYEKIKSEAVDKIYNILFSIKRDGSEEYEEYYNGNVSFDNEREEYMFINNLEYLTDIDAIDTFRVVRIDYVKPELQDGESIRRSFEAQADRYGADDINEYTVLYEYNGNTYFGAMSLIKYDDKWYIDQTLSNILGLRAEGYIGQMSEAEYLEFIA